MVWKPSMRNGEVDERRGRKVYVGDVITYENQEIKVIK